MSDTTVSIELLDQEFKVKCRRENIAALTEAARYLDSKMRECSKSNRLSLQQIFMIASLEAIHELMDLRQQNGNSADTFNKRIQELQNKIDQALAQ